MAKNDKKGITKKDLEERIARGDFRISTSYRFKDGQKELHVDYKDVDKNYFLKSNTLIQYFSEKYPHQQFIILED